MALSEARQFGRVSTPKIPNFWVPKGPTSPTIASSSGFIQADS
jgi:hypothetical protein